MPFFIYFYNCFLDKGCHKGAKPESLQMSQSLSKHLGPKVNTWNKNYITANPWAHWRNYYLSICESSFVCEQILVCAFFFWQYTSQLTSMMPCATYHLTVSMSPLCELSHSVSFQLAGYCFSNYGRLLLWWQCEATGQYPSNSFPSQTVTPDRSVFLTFATFPKYSTVAVWVLKTSESFMSVLWVQVRTLLQLGQSL